MIELKVVGKWRHRGISKCLGTIAMLRVWHLNYFILYIPLGTANCIYFSANLTSRLYYFKDLTFNYINYIDDKF